MSDQVNADSQQTDTEPTLDDVYRDSGIKETSTDTTQTQTSAPAPAQRFEPSVPDPFTETDAFKNTIAQQQQGLQYTSQAVQVLAQYLSGIQQKEAQQMIKKDISTAVETVNEVVQHKNPRVVEAMLHAKAMDDPKFQALWNNRYKNPAAWTSALKVVSRDMQKEFDVKADAGLVAAQRARRTAQGQMSTTAQEKSDDSWDGISEEDFGRRWSNMTNT